MNAILRRMLGLALAFGALSPAFAASPPAVRIGVLAFRPKPQTLEQWAPLAKALKRAIPSRDFVVEAFTFPELEAAVAGKRVDFVLTNPGHYVLLANNKSLSAPIATQVDDENGNPLSTFGGVIFTTAGRRDIERLSDIRHRTVAATATDSMGGYQAQAYELSLAGIRFPGDATLLPTGMPHDNAVAAVLNGRAEVGFVRTGVLENMAREGRLDMSRIKILNRRPTAAFPWTVSTRLYPEWPISVLPHVDADLARHVAAALFLIDGDAARSMSIKGFTIPADYNVVEDMLHELRLPPFDAAPRFTFRDVWERYRVAMVVALAFGALICLLGMSLLVANRSLASSRRTAQEKTQQATRALDGLRAAQTQLVQSEKMASLGQLVANIAHEINTPIGAVKSSGENIAGALDGMLDAMPRLFQTLDQPSRELFMRLIAHSKVPDRVLSTREERDATREVMRQLEEAGIDDARRKAGVMTRLQAQASVADYLPLLRHPESRLILDAAQSIAAIVQNTGNINTAVGRIAKIVFALKSFSHSDAAGELVEARLQDGLDTVLTIYGHHIRQGFELVREYDEAPPILCLPDELNQVWTNLIHNALQAMSGKGTLTIGLKRAGGEAVVSVGDTGCGIPEAIRSKIFDAFFTTKPTGEGSGLGLDIVRKIIEKHKGRIELRSEVGAGSTFTVYLPYDAAEPKPA